MADNQRNLTDAQAAEFIRQQAIGLAQQAKRAGLPMLAYLFEMAIAEADDVVRRSQSEGPTQDARGGIDTSNRRSKPTRPEEKGS